MVPLSVVLPSMQKIIVFGELVVYTDLVPVIGIILGVRGIREDNMKFGGVVGCVSEFDNNIVIPE